MMKSSYSAWMCGLNAEGSNKASSYVRALELLGPILAKHSAKYSQCSDIFAIQSVKLIDELYEYVLEQQTIGDAGIFDTNYKPSYWRSGFYSAALKSYQEFLILRQFEEGLWEVYNTPELDAAELGRRLARKKIKSIEGLVPERDMDFSTREGKEVLRQIKARVNQDFFRDMILLDYGTQCCVTGLNVPGVLRASHIVGWAEDKEPRMNPANGLCLSATYDAAFDRHLISFDEDYRMILSPNLKEYYSNKAFKVYFTALEGCQISFPKRYRPDQKFLARHRNRLCA